MAGYLSSIRSRSGSADLRAMRSSSCGPHTGRKSHQAQARSFAGSRQEAELDRPIDDLERLDASPPRLRQQRNRPDLVASGRGAEEQPRFGTPPCR